MPALEPGKSAPNITLATTEGKNFSLDEARQSTPVVVAFFKVGCPTCQYAFPFLERLYKAYSKEKVRFVGISQDNAKNTAEFAKEFGVTFPILLDDTRSYPASNAYELTTVPSIFLVSPSGTVELTSVGWVRPEFESLNQKVAQAEQIAPAAIFRPGEEVKDFKAG